MSLIFNNKITQDLACLSQSSMSPLVSGAHDSSIINSLSIMSGILSKYYFYLKVAFILFIFVLHLYFLLYNDESLETELKYKESSLSNLKRILKEQSVFILTLGGYYAAIVNADTAKLNNEIITKQIESQKILDKVVKLEEEKTEAVDKLKITFGGVRSLSTKVDQMKSVTDEAQTSFKDIKFQDTSVDAIVKKLANTSNANERQVILAEYYAAAAKRKHELDFIESKVNKTKDLTNDLEILREEILKDSTSSSTSQVENIPQDSENLIKESDIKKSSILDIDWYNELSLIKQIAVLLLLSQSVVISALLSIIYIYYGQILIDKYNLEEKFPKLATIIKYRKTFSKYYFIHSCVMITAVSLSQIAFSIGILSL